MKRHGESRKNALFVSAATVIIIILIPNFAQAGLVQFDIPAEPATKAIPAFARQSGLQIFAMTDELTGIITAAVEGAVDSRTALAQMLAGTDLVVTSDDGTVITIGKPRCPKAHCIFPAHQPINAGSRAPARRMGRSDSRSSDEVSEILVTAQKRKEKIQDVPISITAVTAKEIQQAGATTNLNLTELVPGLKIDRVAAFTDPAIRGISTFVDVPGADPNVATYIDGIYQPNPAAGTFDLSDVQRIDVSKGPQGTLFGRNATGGAIEVFTLDPSDTFTGRVGFGYGSYNDQTAKAYLAGPIIDRKLFGSVSAFEETADSYYKNIGPKFNLRGISSYAVRGKLLVKPTDDFRVTLIGFMGQHGDASAVLNTPLDGISAAEGIPGAIIPNRPYEVAGNVSPKEVTNGHAVSGKAEYDTRFGTFTLTASYNYSNSHIILPVFDAYIPAGGEYYYAKSPANTYQAELDLASVKYGPFSYIMGVNYYNDSEAYSPLVIESDHADVATLYSRLDSLAYSAFGEATYQLTRNLTAVVGARYSFETRDLYGNLYSPGASTVNPPDGWPHITSKNFVGVTPRFSLRYKIGPNSNVYFTYSEGFKSGLFSGTVPPAGSTSSDGIGIVRPERLRASEIGVKSAPTRWYNFDAAAFWYKYSNEQLTSYDSVNGLPLGSSQNAASSTIYGLDLEGKARPIPELTLHVGVSLLHTQFDSFPNAQFSEPAPGNAGNITLLDDARGHNLPRAPSWTASLSGTYAKDYAVGHVSLTANIYHSDKIYYDVINYYSQGQYTDVGVQAAYQPGRFPNLTFSVYGKNLTDNAVILGTYIQANASAVSWAPPRTFGFDIAYDF